MIVITGATKGIGRALAEKFASNGHDLFLCARSTDDLAGLQSDFEENFGVKIHVFTADLSDQTQTDAFAAAVLNSEKPLEALINNAAYFNFGDILTEAEGELERNLATNVTAPYRLCRALASILKENRGHIFNIGSIASRQAKSDMPSYCISKHALLGMHRVLAETLRPAVRVTIVMPGSVWTSAWEGSGVDPQTLSAASDVADAVFAAFNMSPRTVLDEISLAPQS